LKKFEKGDKGQSEKIHLSLSHDRDGTDEISVPQERTEFSSLLGMLAGGGMSTEEYCKQKQLNKELE
jgi:hypothetical protein